MSIFLAQALTNYAFRIPPRTVGGVALPAVSTRNDFSDELFMSVQTRHSGLAVISLSMEGTTVLAVYMLAMMLAPVPLMIAVRSTSRSTHRGVYVDTCAADANAGAASAADATNRTTHRDSSQGGHHPTARAEKVRDPEARHNGVRM